LQFGLQLLSSGFLRGVSEGRSPVAEFHVPLKISDCTIDGAGEKAAKFWRFPVSSRWPEADRLSAETSGSTMIVGFLIGVSGLNSDHSHAVWRVIARSSMTGERQS
jgi:hypothetical protein